MGVVLVLDRRRALRPVALQDAQAAELLPGFGEDERMASFHLVEAGGGVHSAGEALSRLMNFLPGGRVFAAITRRWPAATERAYRLVADNRDRLGPLIPGALKQRATAVIDRRT
jgi:predicted DCC family thiol-disulfide oxidoreductase YuxK